MAEWCGSKCDGTVEQWPCGMIYIGWNIGTPI